jgi:hypothetical protein
MSLCGSRLVHTTAFFLICPKLVFSLTRCMEVEKGDQPLLLSGAAQASIS